MSFPDRSPLFSHPLLSSTPLPDLQTRYRELQGRVIQGRHQAHLRAELVRIELEIMKRESAEGSKTLDLCRRNSCIPAGNSV